MPSTRGQVQHGIRPQFAEATTAIAHAITAAVSEVKPHAAAGRKSMAAPPKPAAAGSASTPAAAGSGINTPGARGG